MRRFCVLAGLFLAWSALVCAQAAPATRAASNPYGWHHLGRAMQVKKLANGVELRADQALMRVVALTDDIVRVQIAPDGKLPADNSWAILPEAVAAMKPSQAVKITDSIGAVEIATAAMIARIEKNGFRVVFMDTARNVISEDDPRRPLEWNTARLSSKGVERSFVEPEKAGQRSATSFRIWKLMPEDEHYFGLGDKAGPLDRREMAFSMWNTDAFLWQESTDPLYKSIPFFLGLRNGRSYGLFLDNTYRTSFDFGKAARDAYSFGSDDGPIDYWFFYGPHPKHVIESYTALTGRTPLPALWTLGYQQSRYSYFPEARVREIAQIFKEKHIPLDAIYLDIDYQTVNRPFTVDPQKFPNFDQMVKDLRTEGIKTIAIVGMHLWAQPGYAPYDSGVAGDHFVKNPDGTVFIGKVWPGDSAFPDFTSGAATRAWWGSLYKDFVGKGVVGFWNDMNEPAVFERPNDDKTMPLDVVHRVAMPDGSERKADHREIHNVYGMQNVRATYEGLLTLRPDQRPFVLTRAAYAGTQRFAASWTGDNSSSWNHMRLSIPTLLNLGVSGYANVGDDIGGFIGSPAPELLTRWMELGAFNPLYRNHTMKGSADQEPWVHGPEHEAIRKRYIEQRYRLIPYIYTAFEENSRTGDPVMRPLFLEYPDDRKETVTSSSEFLFGRDLLVTPKVYEFMPQAEVEFPRGTWIDYWTGDRVEGGKQREVATPMEQMPVWVREGAIIPQMPVVENLDKMPDGPLELHIYAPAPGSKADCSGSLYWDDGTSFQYKNGAFLRMNFTCESTAEKISLHTQQEGSFAPWWKEVSVVFHGVNKMPARVFSIAEHYSGAFDMQRHTYAVTVPASAMAGDVRIWY